MKVFHKLLFLAGGHSLGRKGRPQNGVRKDPQDVSLYIDYVR